MKIKQISSAQDMSKSPDSVLVLGYFDGLHRGHQALIDQARRLAEKEALEVVLLTFPESPRLMFEKYQEDMLLHLLSFSEMAKRLDEMGVTKLYLKPFTASFSQLTAQEFVASYIQALSPKYVLAGFDYRMGRDKQLLSEVTNLSPAKPIIVEKISDEVGKISSTRIRQALKDGDVTLANHLLGYEFPTTGLVVHGDARGRTIGYPTANIALTERTHLPADGVYVTDVLIAGKRYRAMTSLGKNTTFGGTQLRLEANIFDFDGDLYGEELTILWLDKIRDMVTFDGVDALIAQLENDKAIALAYEKE
ncbi:bifunctional riboflavin kinase/FAD synthetase [Streptococcus sp. DD12]|uniref:bifunctional riboflavin kinase/FAD synthetase n=1 Tax=Streptococcus sp. DD12 TaxID=1777880 RepID=UPI00079A7D4A|nr:bifunctional riboflavin kinase/FAD synthetase [Streptococcus sp. DD12]KXT76818.1 Riboflavin kinase / FMN adenylyltransferase [Streptococcus sp. DD12]